MQCSKNKNSDLAGQLSSKEKFAIHSASTYLPSVATEESGRANHFPRGRKFSFSRDLEKEQYFEMP